MRIEGLRRGKRAEELQRIEDRKIAAENKKRALEAEKAKAAGKNEVKIIPVSYDFKGKPITVQALNKFPALALDYGNSVKIHSDPPRMEGAAKRISRKISVGAANATKKKKDENIDDWYFKTEQGKKQEEEKIEKNATLSGVYDSFIPAIGVAFIEKGKNAKVAAQKVSEKQGKPNKSEYYSILAQGSLKASGSMPSLFPDINKTLRTENNSKLDSTNSRDLTMPVESNNKSFKSKKNKTGASESNLEIEYSKDSQNLFGEEKSDLSQLIVANPSSFLTMNNSGAPSLLPRVQHSRLHKNMRNSSVTPLAHKFDIESLNPDGSQTMRSKQGPIIKGELPTPRLIREALGDIKKLPRERKFINSKYYKIKLPPPPLGFTQGHGIVDHNISQI